MRQITRTLGVSAALALALTLAPGCSMKSDAVLTSKVKTKLAADPQVNPFEIDVDTTDGVVRLSGQVEDIGDRAEAERLASRTRGVKRVINEIQIDDPDAENVASDTWIETKIKAKLVADPEVNPFNVDVDVIDGVVTLTGKVDDQVTCDAAIALAKDTRGVKRVENRIEVKKNS